MGLAIEGIDVSGCTDLRTKLVRPPSRDKCIIWLLAILVHHTSVCLVFSSLIGCVHCIVWLLSLSLFLSLSVSLVIVRLRDCTPNVHSVALRSNVH